METQYYVTWNGERYYDARDFGGSLDKLKQFAEFWGVEVFEDLPK